MQTDARTASERCSSDGDEWGRCSARRLLGRSRFSSRSEIADTRPQALAHARSLLGDVEQVDDANIAIEKVEAEACVIATPTPSHPALVRAALERGLHVFCEKPLSFDPDAAAHLAILARERQLVLQIGFFRRFSRPWMFGLAAAKSGRIGEIVLIKSTTWDMVLPPLEFCDPAVSGGLVVDNGVHEFDVAAWLGGGSIEAVAAVNAPEPAERLARVGDVGCAAVLLRLDNGVVAVVDLSRNARYADDMRTEILGTEGAVFIESVGGGRARLATAAGVETIEGSEVADAFADGISGELAGFAESCRGTDRDYAGGLASAHASRAALAAQRAVIEKRWVAVNEVAALSTIAVDAAS